MAFNELDKIASLHIPVLRDELLSFFEPNDGDVFLDGTLGLGGHSFALLEKAQDAGAKIKILGLDRDAEALELAKKRLSPFSASLNSQHCRFSEFELVLDEAGISQLNGAFIDIGVSSLQLDNNERGFSFIKEGPLDMRMDRSFGEPAANIVNRFSVERLKEIISTYGEEPMAGRIARAIDDARSIERIDSTESLARIVEKAYPAKWRAKARMHPATKTFQALRIVVNNELEELENFLAKIVPWLAPGARVAVISFHSLEDRIVKNSLRDQAKGCDCPRQIPVCICHKVPQLKVLTKKPMGPAAEEESKNPRARSAKLRVAEKLDTDKKG